MIAPEIRTRTAITSVYRKKRGTKMKVRSAAMAVEIIWVA